MQKLYLPIFTISHFLVDCLCICCLFTSVNNLPVTEMWMLVLTYNFLAFVSQPLTGFIVDLVDSTKSIIISVIGLLLTGTLVCSLHIDALVLWGVLLLGMGNSMFHVLGGKVVASSSDNSPKSLGVFVSTGAIGIAVGGSYASVGLQLILVACISILLGIAAYDRSKLTVCIAGCNNMTQTVCGKEPLHIGKGWFLLSGVLLIVFARSFYTTFITASYLSMFFVCLSATLGKAMGGYISHWIGIRRTLYSSLLLAGFLFVLTGIDNTFVYLAIFLMSVTMPLTLYISNRYLAGYEGFSFGLLAALLFPGYFIAKLCQGSSMAEYILAILLLTIVIEAIVLLCVKVRDPKILLVSVYANILTNVPLNLLVLDQHLSYTPILGLGMLVVIIEALLYYMVTKDTKLSLKYSIICNSVSFLFGLLIAGI